MISYYDSVYDKAMTQSISDTEKIKAAASVLKVFHETVWTCNGNHIICPSIHHPSFVVRIITFNLHLFLHLWFVLPHARWKTIQELLFVFVFDIFTPSRWSVPPVYECDSVFYSKGLVSLLWATESYWSSGQIKSLFVCVFQLNCCGKGQGTSFLTHFTDKLGLTDLCPSSGTAVVSVITRLNSITFMHKQQPNRTHALTRLKLYFIFSQLIFVKCTLYMTALIVVKKLHYNRHETHQTSRHSKA